jgi:hypothetical protein
VRRVTRRIEVNAQVAEPVADLRERPPFVALARRGAPVVEQPGLDVRGRERLPQQRVIAEIDLADGQVVRGPPVRVEESDLFGRHRHALISR